LVSSFAPFDNGLSRFAFAEAEDYDGVKGEVRMTV